MERNNVWCIVRNLNYSLDDSEVDCLTNDIMKKIDDGTYDFSNYCKKVLTQQGKKRIIYCYPKLSVENILCQYLKKEIDKVFKIRYASRNRIVNILFNVLPVTKDMNDFVIIRVDFKNFFDSVLSGHVYNKYIRESMLKRHDKMILEKYIHEFKFCYAGLCLSNGLTEIVCRDFDARIKAHLSEYGLFFYERYVDDILLITNRHISEIRFDDIVEKTIRDVFGECPIRLNKQSGKYSYITRRNLISIQKFNYLGYEFEIQENKNTKQVSFRYGITEKKRKRYAGIIEKAFIQYQKDGNIELLRQRIKIYSSRVVIGKTVFSKYNDWLTKGVVANYNELRFHMDSLLPDTNRFLRNIYFDLLHKYKCSIPYFLIQSSRDESIYNIASNLKRNRSIIFEKNIGVSEETLLKWIKRIEPSYDSRKKEYYRMVLDYIELLKVE